MKRKVPERISIYDVRDAVAEYYGIDSRGPAWYLLEPAIRDAHEQSARRFAAAHSAMQGLLANPVYTTAGVAGGLTSDGFIKGIAVDAVRHADALIAELDKEPTS